VADTVAGMGTSFAYLDHPGPIPFAHRGGTAAWPENTFAAFEHAVSLGYRYLETDVHRTLDGVVVAFHDDVLDRVTDRGGAVARMRWSEVRAARVAGAHEIVRLDDLLAAFPDRHFNIDPKHDAVVEPLAEVIRRARAVDRVCVGSFRDARTDRIRQLLGPSLCTAGGRLAVARMRLATMGGGTRSPAFACVQVPPAVRSLPLVDRRFLRSAERSGIAVHVWTINEADAMHRLLDLGVDGIMSDDTVLLRDVLRSRGQWHAA
jgi:glycerophosphoryl diester phosphodiesterase